MSANRVLRRIFGPKRDEVTEGWEKLHNLMVKLRSMRWARHLARMGTKRKENISWKAKKETSGKTRT
jgi:hypothetical protein